MDLEIKWIEICIEIELKHKKWQISMILLTVYFQNTSSTSADVTPSIFTETVWLSETAWLSGTLQFVCSQI